MTTNKKVVDLHPSENDRSSVQEELDALNYQLKLVMKSIGKIAEFNNLVNVWEVESIQRAVSTARQRSYRAEQCALGLKVLKAT
ncbi:hypothetical protein [Endozoicomonas acroporae]|uniref:hypothetical protein n=1 Tax=Endozoicomonas acroporae TaxID=1701104 RepID=UPI0013D1DDD8|nr:hypothetical protein [Endozoicomonas acroporae]